MEKKVNWIDAHCHLTRFERLPAVGRWVLGGVDPQDWQQQRALKATLGNRVFTAFGLHPWWVAEHGLEALNQWEIEAPEAQLLGEMGLDALRPNLEVQREAFQRQLKKAAELKKPVVLHIVQAHEEALALLKGFSLTGIVHGFSGNAQTAERYIKQGFLISVGPQVRREGYRHLKEAVPLLPSEKFVVETDAPDQCPELEDLKKVAEAVGKLRGQTEMEVLDQSRRNLEALLCRE